MEMSSFMEQLIQQLINGISLGSIYALIALGYTMVYGIIKLINFAHGDIYMIGAYAGFFATAMFKLPFIPALLVAMVVSGIIGMIIERLAYRPLRHAPKIAVLITAIGVSLLLEYGSMLLFTPQPRTFPAVFEGSYISLWPVRYQQPAISDHACFCYFNGCIDLCSSKNENW